MNIWHNPHTQYIWVLGSAPKYNLDIPKEAPNLYTDIMVHWTFTEKTLSSDVTCYYSLNTWNFHLKIEELPWPLLTILHISITFSWHWIFRNHFTLFSCFTKRQDLAIMLSHNMGCATCKAFLQKTGLNTPCMYFLNTTSNWFVRPQD